MAACDAEDPYFESFFHLRLADRVVFWNEKDPDDRASLIAGLSVPGIQPP